MAKPNDDPLIGEPLEIILGGVTIGGQPNPEVLGVARMPLEVAGEVLADLIVPLDNLAAHRKRLP